ncbi:monocarboxylate transporter 13-like [Schistocerca nitens]|uniref:monocarboxylate transporter 13-like n=1 Tax=Schistocerca nitens TaxID=7011 RepID=UPI002117EDC9|nr:monocarboxylate transporter 13-like [Schistocerca nitens]
MLNDDQQHSTDGNREEHQNKEEEEEREEEDKQRTPDQYETEKLLATEEEKAGTAPPEQEQQPPQQGGAVDGGQPPAPDGGWGWIVAAAVAFSCVVMLTAAMSFPFVFADYLEQIGHGTEAMTTLTSICMSISSFSGLLCNQLFRRFSCRQIGLVGAAFYVLAQGPVAFATSFVHFVLSSISAGIGLGLVMPAAFTCFNSYFERRRTFAMGLVQLAVGLGTVGIPFMAQQLVAAIGFRATQGVLCAVSALLFPGIAVLRPIKHAEKSDDFGSTLNSASQNGKTVETFAEKETDTKNGLAVDYADRNIINAQKVQPENHSSSVALGNDVKSLEKEKQDLLEKETNFTDENSGSKRVQRKDARWQPRVSVTSVSSLPFPDAVVTTPKKASKSWWLTVVDLFDLRLLQDLRCANILVGMALSLFIDLVFFTLLPLYLFHKEFSRQDSALCMSVMGMADLAGRFSLAVIGACCSPSNRLIFLCSAAASVLLRTSYIFVSNFTAVVVLSALLGFCKCFMLAVSPLVIAEACAPERFPAAFGLQTVMGGVLNMAFGPAIGKLRDVTGSYAACFLALMVLGLLCVVPWTIEMVVTTLRSRKKPLA